MILCDKPDLLMSFDGTPGIVARGFEGAISSGIRIIEPDERKVLSINEGKSLKDLAYEIIEGYVECCTLPPEKTKEV